MLKNWQLLAIIVLPITLFAEVKIGYIDSQKILTNYQGRLELEQELETAQQNWENEATQMKQEIEQMVAEYESQAVMLSEKARIEKQNAIGGKQQEYQQFIQQIWGVGGRAELKQRDVMQPFVDKISEIIDAIGEDEGYTMIFDIANMGVVYADEELDLTQRILDELNREYIVTEEEVFTGFEKIEFYVFKLKEMNKEAQDFGLGQTLKEKIRAAIVKMESYEEVRATTMTNAFILTNITTTEDELIEEEVKAIGRIADADFMITGEVEKTADIITANISLLDVKKEEIVATAEAKSAGDREEDKIIMVSDLVAEILPYMQTEN